MRAAKCSVTQVPVVTGTRARGEVVIVMAACGKRHIKYQNIVIGHISALLRSYTHAFNRVDGCGLTFP